MKSEMKKILLTLFILLLIPVNVGAVVITAEPTEGTTSVEKSFNYHITVTNDKGDPDRFILTVFGPHLEWANLQSYYFQMKPHESKEIGLNFYPLKEGSYEYKVQVRSVSSEGAAKDVYDTTTLKLEVTPLIDPDITDFSVDLIGSELKINVKVTAKKTNKVEANFVITDSKKNKVKVFSTTREIEGEGVISETIPIEDMLSGYYSLEVSLTGSGVRRVADFYVPPVHNIVTSKRVVSTPLMKEVTITISNEGNVVDNYSVEEDLPANQYVTLVDEPSTKYVKKNDVVFQWSLTGLDVGETVEVKYVVDYWKHALGWAIVIFAVMGLLGLGVVKMRRPGIRKRCMRKRDGHLVVLEIRGSLTRELRNVLVKDRVSPLGKVLPEFEGPKPIVRESESGTELIWRLGDVKPRSEIYLTYKIRPLIEAQLKMPRAYLTYRTDDEKKVRVFSKQLILE